GRVPRAPRATASGPALGRHRHARAAHRHQGGRHAADVPPEGGPGRRGGRAGHPQTARRRPRRQRVPRRVRSDRRGRPRDRDAHPVRPGDPDQPRVVHRRAPGPCRRATREPDGRARPGPERSPAAPAPDQELPGASDRRIRDGPVPRLLVLDRRPRHTVEADVQLHHVHLHARGTGQQRGAAGAHDPDRVMQRGADTMNAEQRGGGRSTETRGSSRTIRTGGTSSSSTSTSTATTAPASAPVAPPPATIKFFNRDIVTLRASYYGVLPADRAAQAANRIREAVARDGPGAVKMVTTPEGLNVTIDGVYVFRILDGDLDAEDGQTFDEARAVVGKRLDAAIEAAHSSIRGGELAWALVLTLAAAAAFCLAVWLLARGRRWLRQRLDTYLTRRLRIWEEERTTLARVIRTFGHFVFLGIVL